RADVLHGIVRHAQQAASRRLCVDDAAAEEVRRGARYGEQRGRNEAAGGRLRDGEGLLALLEQRAQRGGDRQVVRHGAPDNGGRLSPPGQRLRANAAMWMNDQSASGWRAQARNAAAMASSSARVARPYSTMRPPMGEVSSRSA